MYVSVRGSRQKEEIKQGLNRAGFCGSVDLGAFLFSEC